MEDMKLAICYNLNQRTDKKVLPVELPHFLVNDECRSCLSRMGFFHKDTDKMDAIVSMIEQIESEYIFLQDYQFMYVEDELRVKIRYSE